MDKWIVIHANGYIETAEGILGNALALADINMIDIVMTQDPTMRLVVDDNGLLKELPLNPLGTYLYGSVIVGDVVLAEYRRRPEPDIYPFEEGEDLEDLIYGLQVISDVLSGMRYDPMHNRWIE